MVKIRFNNTSYLVKTLDIATNSTVTVRYPDGTEEWIYLKDWERYLSTKKEFEQQ